MATKMKRKEEPFSRLDQPSDKIRGIVPKKEIEEKPVQQESEDISIDYSAETHFGNYVDDKLDKTTDYLDERMKKAASKSVGALGEAAGKIMAVLKSVKAE